MAVSPETRRGRWVPRIKLYRIKNEKSNLSKKQKNAWISKFLLQFSKPVDCKRQLIKNVRTFY